MKKCYITTPIYYPNADPHLGSAYTTLASDFFARLYRELGYKTFFLTGTDEHGEKLAKAAAESDMKPQDFVDAMAEKYRAAWKELDTSNDGFIRTTDAQHKAVVRAFLMKVFEKGDIYQGVYEGYYCVGCERYYTEKELGLELKCPFHYKSVESRRIDAYFFKMSKYREALLEHYKQHPEFLPPHYKDQIINKLDELNDLCISRPIKQVSWGIPLPFDEEHVAYVWFDALLNYLSGVESDMELWPPDLQFMGKDIIWFHCVIWPTMLMSAGYKLPRRIAGHGFLTVDGKKMSKSLGNVVEPLSIAKQYSSDTLRYYLLTKVPFGTDGDFSLKMFKDVHNNELLSHYGNLANRLAKLSHTIGAEEAVYLRAAQLKALRAELEDLAANYKLEEILRLYGEKVWHEVTELNAYLNQEEPWKKKDNSKAVIGAALEGFYYLTIILKPLLPSATSHVIKAVGHDVHISHLELNNLKKLKVPETLMLYKKVE